MQIRRLEYTGVANVCKTKIKVRGGRFLSMIKAIFECDLLHSCLLWNEKPCLLKKKYCFQFPAKLV